MFPERLRLLGFLILCYQAPGLQTRLKELIVALDSFTIRNHALKVLYVTLSVVSW